MSQLDPALEEAAQLAGADQYSVYRHYFTSYSTAFFWAGGLFGVSHLD